MYFQPSSCLCFNISNLFIFSLDLMSSPRNPLNQRVLERTAATYFIIFIVNQLFISNNDVIELDWLEREFFATDRTKWDGVLIKADNRSCSAGLIEFSGDIMIKPQIQKTIVILPSSTQNWLRCSMLNRLQLHYKRSVCVIMVRLRFILKFFIFNYCSFFSQQINVLMSVFNSDYNNNHNVNSNATFTLTEEQKEALYQRFAQRYYGIYTCNKVIM